MPRAACHQDHGVCLLAIVQSRARSALEIATALFVGESTVKTHVRHILEKLAVRDRVQAPILAYEAGLVRAGQA
jgi:DNA-binding CsgD family transcriptional regulator